jgi:uncharacterized protein YecE (DUF72 family)
MTRNVNEAFEFWITQFPESFHPLDERRFYDFAEAAAVADEYINANWLIEHAKQYKHNLTDEQLADFGSKLDTIREYLQDRKSV